MKRNRSIGRDTLLLDVWLVSHLTGRLLDDSLRPVGLTGDEFGLYSLIYSFGPITPTQICRWTGLAPTTVSSTLRRVTARGHLAAETDPSDGRSRLLALSPAGVDVTTRAAVILGAALPLLEEVLDAGPEAIRWALGDLDGALRRLTGTAPRPYETAPAGVSPREATVDYPGPRLSAAQSAEVRAFIDWLRARDGSTSS
jgi:DNA-binding MarR family transcriptional regulator